MATTSTTSTGGLSLSGLASGINWTTIISEMLTEEAAPETQMQTEENTENQQNAALQAIATQLTTFGSDVTNLSNPDFFNSRTTALSDSSVATATAASGTPLGNYTLNVTQLASDSVQVGNTATSAPLNSSNDVSSLVLSSAGFATPVTAGTFTVNGQTITVSTSDTLQDVFNQISTATSGAVTGSYDSSTDEVTLSSSSPVVLGSDTDTSNFLQATELYNTGTPSDSITSASALGGINLTNNMDEANFATPISDGGSGNGEFIINGATINFDASTDSVSSVLQQINDSAAGVTATYDSLDNRFELTNTSTGDVGISLQDVTGNFLAATGLSGGTLQQGNNLEYSVNNGGTMTSQSNTVDLGSSGATGLSVTAMNTGSTTIAVQSDTSTISSAINSFVTDYNAVQNYISSQTASTTSSTGTVTPGLFTGNLDVENLATTLRQMTDATPGSSTPGYENLNEIGVSSNGTDNTLSIDSTTLSAALTNNLSAVENLFTNPTVGIAATLNTYLGSTTSTTGVLGSSGMISTDEASLTSETQALANSITNLQAQISASQTTLTNEFTNMETAINSINEEKDYLNSYFGNNSGNAAPAAAGASDSSSSSDSSDSSSSSST